MEEVLVPVGDQEPEALVVDDANDLADDALLSWGFVGSPFGLSMVIE